MGTPTPPRNTDAAAASSSVAREPAAAADAAAAAAGASAAGAASGAGAGAPPETLTEDLTQAISSGGEIQSEEMQGDADEMQVEALDSARGVAPAAAAAD